MKRILSLIIIILITLTVKAQYPFDSLPSIHYKKYAHWKRYDKSKKEGKKQSTKTLPNFFINQDTLTIQLTSFELEDSSIIRIYRNNKQIQKLYEPYSIGDNTFRLYDNLYVADFNNDGLLDLKILSWYAGCGLASENVRVIYLFQNKDNTFTKISYLDMDASNHTEKDFDNDGNFEIITKSIDSYENHSYWVFNIYNYIDGKLICVNEKYNYPIMVQYLNKENYKITNKISRQKMKDFEKKTPELLDIRK